MALATLSIDLEARLAKLEQDLNQAARISEKHSQRMEAAFSRVKLAGAAIGVSLISGLSVSAIMDFVERTTEAADQITRLAELSGSNTTEFQKFATGAKSVGMDMEKFSDVMKDVQDKLGDFFVSGGGELKDFFEKIAPKIKITAEEFRNLSGPEALQLFYTSLEKANVGQKVLINQMEAVADDAALLIPLLRDGGAGFAELAAKAEAAGMVMSEKAIKEAAELSKQMKEMKANVEGAGHSINSALIPVINNLSREFKAGKDAFGGFWSAWGNLGMARPFENAVTGLQHYQAKFKEVQGTLDRIAEGKEPSTGIYGTDRLGPLKEQAAELQKFVSYYENLLGLSSKAGAGRGIVNPIAKDLEPWKIPQDKEKTPTTEAERYLEQLQKASDKLRDLSDYDQALIDIGRGMDGLTPAIQKRVLALADENDKKREGAFFTEKLAAAEERWSKDFMGPELPPDMEAQLKRLHELLEATPTAKLEDARRDMLLLADSFNVGRISAEEFTEAAQTRLGTLPDDLKKVETLFDDLKSSIEGWGKDSASAIVDFSITGKSSFGDMVNSMLADMARMATYRLVTQPLFNAIGAMLPTGGFGAGGGGDVAGPGLKLQADGGVWDNGIQRFASGGVFGDVQTFAPLQRMEAALQDTRRAVPQLELSNQVIGVPTLFRHAGGLGELGEAGPEAIMPLQPAAGGGLGVMADLGGDQTVVPVARMPGGRLGISLQRLEDTMRSLASDTAPQRFATGGVVGAVQTPAPMQRLQAVMQDTMRAAPQLELSNQVIGVPTLFRHAGGLGELGEAGPEAIMPLQPAAGGGLGVMADLGGDQTVVPVARMSGGRLGISLQRLEDTMRSLASEAAPQRFATGGVFGAVQTPAPLPRLADGRLLAASRQASGDGGNVTVQIINNHGSAKVEQHTVSDGRGGRRIEVAIGEMLAGEMSRPGSALNRSARAGFGLTPALVRR